MTTAAAPYRYLAVNPAGRRNPGWWVMVLVIATEAMFFAFLLFSYFYVGSGAVGPWPPAGPPELRLAAPNTAILLASSAAVWWGERGIAHDAQRQLRVGLLVMLVLGATFLAIQGVEYSRKPFTPQSHAYGSLFYTITGFHGAHVFVGLLMSAVVQLRAWRGHFTAERHLAVTNVAMYWHFVDAVWIAVFLSLYVSPRLV